MAEKEYIDKGYVLYIVKYYAGMQTWSKRNILSEILRKIGREKAADVVEVVRCGNCKQYTENFPNRYKCKQFNVSMPKNGFCSHGERKEGAE